MRPAPGLAAAVVTTCVISVTFGAPRDAAVERRAMPGWATYDRSCLPCHGARGDGRGPAAPYVRPRPRDFTSGNFAWRTTALGQPPTRDDLRAAIRFGAPGTSMPGFDSVLSAREIDDAIMLIESFMPAPAAAASAVIAMPAEPARWPDAARGAALWTQLGCASCHGPGGRGDGPAAAAMAEPPFDLTTQLRRPRSAGSFEDFLPGAPRPVEPDPVALDIWTGIGGTAMPGYAGAIGGDELWALVSYVRSIEVHGVEPPRTLGGLDASAIANDARARIAVGTRPDGGDPDEDALFGSGSTAAPSSAPPALPPAEASTSAQQCARCHAKQVREWTGSIHGGAASPGLRAQIDVMPDAEAASCRRCHTPAAGPSDEGVSCAGCHVRDQRRFGPPNIAPSLLRQPGYPLQTLAIYERGDLCMTCHQLPPRTSVNGKPLLDTYAEWLDGPYMRRGIQCQHCHMPNREHGVLGIHDRDTFRQGIELTASAHRDARGTIGAAAMLRNVGAGHMLPTTPTPAVWLAIELVDARGAALPGTRDERRIGRDLAYDASGWHERADTRIAPGDSAIVVTGWSGDRTAGAVAARITVTVRPDDYYERFYAQRLAARPPPAAPQRTQYEQALARARASGYVAEDRRIAL